MISTILFITGFSGAVHALGIAAAKQSTNWAFVALLEATISSVAFAVKMGWL